jgi:hypothetical protein
MTFRELYLRLNDLAGHAPSGDFETLGKTYLNFVYRRLLDIGRVQHESREFTLTTREGIAQYGMPLYVRRVENVEDTANRQSIYSVAARSFDLEHPGGDEEGTPRKAFPLQTVGVQRQPAEAGPVMLTSSSSVDAGSNYSVTVIGFTAEGNLHRESVQMAGIAGAVSTAFFSRIERLVKVVQQNPFVGDVTVRDSDDHILATVPPWWESPDYFWIEFFPIPDGALTYSIRAEMRKPPLVEDDDWPEIEQEYHDLLIYGAAIDLLPKVGLLEAGLAMKDTFDKRLKEYLARQRDEFELPRVATFANVWNHSAGASIRRPRIER